MLFLFSGYTIPKGTWVYPGVRYIMRDPDYWKDPEKFNPERFLETDKDGKTCLTKNERLVPFGIGKYCPLSPN